MSRPVVVGVDGSAGSAQAVAVAVHEARLRGCGLEVVHAFFWPAVHVPLGPWQPGSPEEMLRETARRLVAEAVEHARAVAPDVEVSGAVVAGGPPTVLQDRSRTAELVVVGSRGLGGFAELLLGATAVQLAAHAACPVMVVRGRLESTASTTASASTPTGTPTGTGTSTTTGTGGSTGPVLLGVDGSPAGAAAVEFAFTEAALRGTGIVALHAWTPWSVPPSPPPDPSAPYAAGPGELAEGERRLLAEATVDCRARHPDVPVEQAPVRGGVREALIEASAGAGLVVVGARGRGGFTGLFLGSVSQAVLHHAHCPVVVVRGSRARS
ncbi:universal stress protein [Streptomyces sp. MS06]|uniref:universal stress protein n=1 Tax=Streptomyces sp. MS06 TaxID=3385974 RepID=UPI0039A2423D